MSPHLKWLVRERQSLATLLLVIGFCCIGCGSPAPPPKPEDGNNLNKILQALRTCVEQNNRPPKNQDELLPFLAQLGNPQELLVSPRDGQPYTIAWGKNPLDFSAIDPLQPIGPVLAHEQIGVGGQRYVATVHGVMLMDEKEFETLRSAEKKP